MKRLLLFLFCICSVYSIKALSVDSLQVSLLTIMPRPNEVYTVYGHTALRISDPSQQMDAVLNYGTFDFDSPDFLYRFLKGETDYFLSTTNYAYFLASYKRSNSTIIEQILDIPNEEKPALLEMLSTNLEPRNREYRYNFLFDNCTTRPRDIIEKFSGGKLVYTEREEKPTFRDLIHSCTNPYPWMTFGIDLVIGNGADSLIGIRQELFLPERLMNALDSSVVINSNSSNRSIVLSSETLATAQYKEMPSYGFWDSPVKMGYAIFILYCIFIIVGWFLKRRLRLPFAILFLTAALAGCIIAFISFISEHPCTWPNWNLLWLHPLHFIAFIGFFFKKSYPLIRWYHASNFVLLSLLLLGWNWIPQELNIACIPYILCLWISSGYEFLSVKINKI